MKYLLLVHHNEEAFGQFSEVTRKAMLAESVQLTHTLHVDGKYVHASPLQSVARSPGSQWPAPLPQLGFRWLAVAPG